MTEKHIKNKLPPNRKKSERTHLRFTPPEMDRIKAEAGNKKVAVYLAEKCLVDLKPGRSLRMLTLEPEMLRHLSGTSRNLNQLAKATHQQKFRASDATPVLLAVRETQKILQELLRHVAR